MEIFSVNEIIEQAIQTEKLGYEFYTGMARRFEKDEELVKLFDTLAQKEKNHEKMFCELKEKAGNQEPENQEEVSIYLRAIVESEFFLGMEKSLPSLEHVQSTEEAVNFAIGFEREALLYFHSLRDVVKEKEIVDKIINEEKSHIMWLSEFKKRLKTNN